MIAPIVPELRRITSQPTITLSVPSSKGPAPQPSATHLTTPRRSSPQPLIPVTSGARSRPSSIPSSPTSVHSSSSAIFERDIEPISFQASPQKFDAHHISRAQTHEPVDSSVPSVLASAVSALTLSPSVNSSIEIPTSVKRSSIFDEEISVISPASTTFPAGMMLSGMTTPRSMSRSPSPPSATGSSPVLRPFILDRLATTPPGALAVGASSSISPDATPVKTTRKEDSASVEGLLMTAGTDSSSVRHDSSTPGASSGPIPRPRKSQTSLSGPPTGDDVSSLSSPTTANKHLSFISYHDLLVSTPMAAAPLSSITSPASIEPPPHVASVSGHASPLRGRISPPGAVGNTNVGWGKDDGGEWEREGLGKGLEERLEEVLAAEAQQQLQLLLPHQQTAVATNAKKH